MDAGKVRELGDAEIGEETRQAAEQLFRIRFQMKLGQTEGVKKLQALKKDVARLKTIQRERALGVRGATSVAAGSIETKKKRRSGTGKAS